MIQSTTFNLRKHQGLYTPSEFDSQCEHIQCTDSVGILRVAAGNASKILSYATLLRHHPTNRTRPGSIGRRHEHKTNTVLFCFGLSPVEYSPVCPWRHSFSKIFSTIFSFTTFKIFKIFHSKNFKIIPRNMIQISIDKILTFPNSSEFS